MVKPCSICGQERPLKPRKTRFYSWCEPCHAERRREYTARYLAKPEKAALMKTVNKTYFDANREKCRQAVAASVKKLKDEMLAAYGPGCSCCGELHEEFLTLEHVNGDGKEHRKKSGGGHGAYRDLRRRGWPKEGYTVLCMNCNWASRLGILCPHKRTT